MKRRNAPFSPLTMRSWNPVANRYGRMLRRIELIVQKRRVSSETKWRLKITTNPTNSVVTRKLYLPFDRHVGVSDKVLVTTRWIIK
jgi:hypothetical protein